jgi:hypothetical protein
LREEYDQEWSRMEEKIGYEEMCGLAWAIEQKSEELKVELAETRLRKRASHVVENENNESDINEAELNLSSREINEVNGNYSWEVKLNNNERNSLVLSHEIVEDGELNTNCDRAHEGTVNGKKSLLVRMLLTFLVGS